MKPRKRVSSTPSGSLDPKTTRLSKPGTIDALRKQVLEDPAARRVYFETRARLRAAKAAKSS